MRLYNLKAPKENKTTVNLFGGINRLPNARPSQFSDMYGIAPGCYPIIRSGLLKSNILEFEGSITKAGHYKRFYYFLNGVLYYDGKQTGFKVEGDIISVVGLGNNLVVFPQKLWFNTDDFSFGSLENKKSAEAVLLLSTEKGEVYGNYTVSETLPESASEGALWLDTSLEEPILKKYVGGSFYAVTDVAVKLQCSTEGFNEGDSICVSSPSFNGSFNIKCIGDGFLTFGSASVLSGKKETITVSREVPDITYACEHGNRIWGCSSGGTEIYASELGKKDCFYTFQNTAADSYSVSIGENTAFKGVCELSGRLYFFKSNFVYMLQGTKPQNYQFMRVSTDGILEDSKCSVVEQGGYLYYFSNLGLVRFDGNSAEKIDKKLSSSIKADFICSSGERLYVVYGRDLYYIDTDMGEFYKIDSDDYEGIYSFGTYLIYAKKGAIGYYSFLENYNTDFSVEFAPFGTDFEKEGFITRLGLGLYLGENAILNVECAYDDGKYRVIKRIRGKAKGFTLPLMPGRCTAFKLRLSGKGVFRLHSLSIYRSEVE